MKRTANAQESTLLISKKAYNDFTTRINQTLSAIAMSSESIAEAINLLDRYAKGEITDLDSTDIMVKVSLMMLKPEIDKAMRRSSAARERVKLRCEKSASASKSNGNPKNPEKSVNSLNSADSLNSGNSENSEISERPMNRRERREYEHELAREQRRYERRMMKRMKG